MFLHVVFVSLSFLTLDLLVFNFLHYVNTMFSYYSLCFIIFVIDINKLTLLSWRKERMEAYPYLFYFISIGISFIV